MAIPEGMLLRHYFVKVELDDKAKMPFGDPGKAVEACTRAHGRVLAAIDEEASTNACAKVYIAQALDHSFHKGSTTFSENLFQFFLVDFSDLSFRHSTSWREHDNSVCLSHLFLSQDWRSKIKILSQPFLKETITSL
jgi:hypothetical protein